MDETLDDGLDDAVEQGDGGFGVSWTYYATYSNTDPSSEWYKCFGLRWDGLNIPQGATIGTAYIQAWPKPNGTDNSNAVLYAHDAAAPTNFSDNAHIISTGDRPRTTANAPWVESDIPTGQYVSSPSLVDVIQELATSYTITAIVILGIANTNNSWVVLFCDDYETDSSHAAKLHIEYSLGAAAKSQSFIIG